MKQTTIPACRQAITTLLLAGLVLCGPAAAQTPKETGQQLLGRWSSTETDKETGVAETLILEFRADGSYLTSLRSGGFQPAKFTGAGRYAVTAADKSGFTLKVERALKEPEADKADASESQQIKWLDPDSLQAADGSIVRRVKK
ncbi:MAG: hypothetical protein EPN60_13090 [Nevskiaceae bacterium]|jgi:hypothetical protein|nr:MAG: hypothetical protein EPO48_03710 [Nevskiaceae bacterium]TAM24858.1 MAG: hypothetical protein EPN60_13090 [Nevskiaceae bacterium]